MFFAKKLKDYRIKGEHFPGEPDFGAYKPRDYGKQEQPGNKDWSGNFLPYVPTILPDSLPPLPKALADLIEHAWVSAQVSPAARAAGRGSLRLGGHREPRAPAPDSKMPPLPKKPDPGYRAIPVTRQDAMTHQIQSQMAPHLKTAFAQDWAHHKEIPRVMAYAFRGDKRDPKMIKQAGGFTPPISRTDEYYFKNTVYPQFRDYLKDKTGLDIAEDQLKRIMNQKLPKELKPQFHHYSVWRAVIERESLHVGRMVAFEALKGFISTTKAVTVAKAYACDESAGNYGFVYVMFVNGGYHLPEKGKDSWTTIFGEQEIAYAGAIPWEMVQGFRAMAPGKIFTGPIYLRDSFDAMEKDSALEVYKLLSGRPQH